MAAVLTAWTKYAASVKPYKTAQLAVRVFGGDSFNSTEEELTLMLSEKLEAFFKKLGLRTSLAQFGIGDEYFEKMADRATKNGTQTVGHYIKLDREKIIGILKLAE